MRAIALLSQREHSPLELRRKLLRIRRDAQEAEDDEDRSAIEVDQLIEWLRAQGYLSETRFVESRVHARAQRYGSLRIKLELAQHGLTLSADAQAELKSTELARARSLWQRKFGANGTGDPDAVAGNPALRARQMRFLSGRGFSPEVIRQVLRGRVED
ncbi:regulatory protein RecX [Paucibacter sp. R3-3]|uniref:Regulatory protein RecX n=2 Tax=Roseateles agri TaxID=3098619 RepID=A0ABU5DGW8_9BURK|nr:regulatory protein RecX [Paucibacter sp. R3-3]MDY0744509.1 regulatory protein RecX [Paucibacter sp. R3-3]